MSSSETTLREGQIWRPANGEDERQIDELHVAGVTDHPHPMGAIMVLWATRSDKWGWCRDKSFKAWIRRTKAQTL